MSPYILIVEDDPKQAELIRVSLLSQGYRAGVAHDAPTALRSIETAPPDLVVLDLMLPGADGLSIRRWLRRRGGTPVLLLIARSAEEDVLAGLDVGVDDYLTEPYSPRELVARIQAVLLRSRVASADADAEPKPTVLRVGDLLVDPDKRSVMRDGKPVACTPDEFAVLAAMAAAPGRVFTRAQLLRHTRGHDRASTERAVDVHILNLRKKIEANPAHPARLVTVYGVGYKLLGDR